MATIETFFDQTDATLTILVKGVVTIEEINQTISKQYPLTRCQMVIWDFCEADMSQLPTQQMDSVIKTARQYSDHRRDAPTIYIGNRPFLYGMLRMYAQKSGITRQGALLTVFHDWDEANEWLQQRDLTPRQRPQ
ncbi:hypothetical protein DV711_12365 [Motiliproteus coralliicola]|uniref:STAS/SEC14 domain-containing protein n=1 Tax=Motiliproteus coralliicola TaxID=2283196 RepID=A0A369WCB8_9GAMM|nr:hypothetical protein [Motiliproteus coralliicola]RDE19670.1 hypothetical protein DV711_12365 [Motiliproteus coralliicola]